jgi:oxygen-independent coproporphyrinogen-3 oxidase
MEGIDLGEVTRRFGAETALQLEKEVSAHIQQGKIRMGNGRLQLTREGKLLADGIAADLFVINDADGGANGAGESANS